MSGNNCMLSKPGNHKRRRHLAKLLCIMITNSQNVHSHSHKYSLRGTLAHSTRFAYYESKTCPCKLMQKYKVLKTKRLLKPSRSSPCQHETAIYNHMWAVGFSSPPFCLTSDVCEIFNKQQECLWNTALRYWKPSEATLAFLTAPKGAQLVSPSCPIPPPSQVQPDDSAFTCQDFCLWV